LVASQNQKEALQNIREAINLYLATNPNELIPSIGGTRPEITPDSMILGTLGQNSILAQFCLDPG
jgi:hypothetical protein